MSNLLEITGEDVAALTDVDLRALIGLLCEADFRVVQLSCRGITWGGSQDAADGGLDVVVRSEVDPPANSFIPKATTGFQVKKPKMGPADIVKEMRPKGVLRPSIKRLVDDKGAYIIASSGDDCATETALKDRIVAIRNAVANDGGGDNLSVDFLDRGRIASWIRAHPSLILKVRQQIGKPLTGWRSYENWAKSPGGTEEEYLLDDGLRLHDGTSSSAKELSVQEGLNRLRRSLSVPGSCIRLTGLSGVGKTRLVQALFDERVASESLNPYLAYYTDMSDSPNPDPNVFAEQLIAARTRGILIVDNCPPELHNRLVRQCAGTNSTVSLLTVEYDVRDNLPDETEVFRLEPASEALIEKLMSKRYPHITQVDVHTIARFSGGNARLAIVLANTVDKGETLSGFREDELFNRLFWQRNEQNRELLISAELCSLVYSFEGTDTQSDSSELRFLASLSRKSVTDLYRDVAILYDRGLVQSRNVWRAILPHAVANRLAKSALECIPREVLVKAFIDGSSERLIKSFTRRLGYLHDNKAAIDIVDELLAPEGWLGKNLGNLNSFGTEVLINIAPVSPGSVLDAIESVSDESEDGFFTSKSNQNSEKFVRLLHHIAYEPDLFLRSAELMSRFALAEDDDWRNDARDALVSLFHAYLSGTHASVEDRVAFIERFVKDIDPSKVELGMQMLNAALEAWHFTSSHEFDFGARKRDFGYQPKTRKEIEHWYNTFLNIGVSLCLSKKPVTDRARKVLAHNMRGLWTKAGILDSLEEAARKIHAVTPWNEGWLALRGIIRFDSERLREDVQRRLHNLESSLRPNELLDQARTFALTDHHSAFDLEDDYDDKKEGAAEGWRKAYDTTREIGKKVAKDKKTLDILLPELVSKHAQRLQTFGEGLAAGSENKPELWTKLRQAFEDATPENRQIGVLRGFLAGCANTDLTFYQSTLDELVEDDVFGPWFPYFQTTAVLDKEGVSRLYRALDAGRAHINTFQHIAYGRVHDAVSDADLAELIEKIISKDGGVNVAVEILMMRFHGKEGEPSRQSDVLKAVTRKVLSAVSYSMDHRKRESNGYKLARLADVCLVAPEGEETAGDVCRKLSLAIQNGAVYAFDFQDFLSSLASIQPRVFLDEFLDNSSEEAYRLERLFVADLEGYRNPLDNIPDEILLSWCDINPDRRYLLIVRSIDPFLQTEGGEGLTWRPIVYTLFEQAPDLDAILDELSGSIRPRGGWTGSLADILEKRLVLFEILFDYENDEVSAWARSRHQATQERIMKQRAFEEQHKRDEFESFE